MELIIFTLANLGIALVGSWYVRSARTKAANSAYLAQGFYNLAKEANEGVVAKEKNISVIESRIKNSLRAAEAIMQEIDSSKETIAMMASEVDDHVTDAAESAEVALLSYKRVADHMSTLVTKKSKKTKKK